MKEGLVIIHDASGKAMLRRSLTGSGQREVDLSGVEGGTYFYSFFVDGALSDGGRFIILK